MPAAIVGSLRVLLSADSAQITSDLGKARAAVKETGAEIRGMGSAGVALRAVTAEIKGVGPALRGVQQASQIATQSLVLLGEKTTPAVSSLTNALGGLLAGGFTPLGVALAAVSVGFSLLASQKEEIVSVFAATEERVKSTREGMEKLRIELGLLRQGKPATGADVDIAGAEEELRRRKSVMETVGDLAFLGYSFASLQGARWRFPLDQESDAVFTFVDDVDPAAQNMSKFQLKLDEWGKSSTGIQGSFWSEAIDFERDELLYPVDGLAEGVPLNVREVDLRGVTRETEAARMLRHLAEQAKALPFPCTWEAHPGVQHVEAGDVVLVRTRVPFSTGTQATEMKVRVLAAVVGRDEEGKLAVRYAGRVLRSSVYSMKPVTVPVSAAAVASTSASSAARATSATAATRAVTGLRARVR